MKNICLFVDSLKGGGAERVVLNLASALTNMGHRVDIVVLGNGVDYCVEHIKYNIHILDILNHKKYLTKKFKYKDLARITEEKVIEIGVKFDLFISNNVVTDKICQYIKVENLYFCIHSSLLNNCKMKKVFITKLLCQLKYSLLIKKLYRKKNIITVSKGVMKSMLSTGLKPKNIEYIYNPVNFLDIRKQADEYVPVENNYIVHVGSFSRVKRHKFLIQAYKKSQVTQKLLLIGNFNTKHGRSCKKLVRDLGLEGQVIFKGFCPNPYPYIKNAKALVLSSEFEGLSMVLIEALVLGVPVISTSCTGPVEILVEELSPFLSPVNSVEEFSKNIKKVIKNPPLITDKFISKFDAEKKATQYLQLCK
ncbi:MAG: glycosyltransferase [Bdellovibrionaceae bacterium]|nr:glycosyltransferase [Pseudobdellovibrionaceae bacterium]